MPRFSLRRPPVPHHAAWQPALHLLAAVAVNTASVALEGRCRLLTRLAGRHGWVFHACLIVPVWASFGRSLRAPDGFGPSWEPAPRAGAVLSVLGAALVVLGFRRVGPLGAVNGDVFGIAPRRPHRSPSPPMLRDPVYVGYSALLAGHGLRRGKPRLLVTAGLMLALLTVEGRVEDWAATQPRAYTVRQVVP